MSLSSAMIASLSGLRAAQSGMAVVANNVANAGSANYVRKSQTNVEAASGTAAAGVRTGDITRILDKLVQSQSWTEAAGGSYASTQAQYHAQLDQLFGTPGDSNALDGIFNSFASSIQALASTPDSTTARTQVVNSAQVLTQQLNGLSSSIQGLRTGAEAAIGSAVSDANTALQGLQKISAQIAQASDSGDSPPAALLDLRDGYVSQLSSLMDVKVVDGDRGSISVFTSGGAMLFDGKSASKLSFDSHGDLGAQSAYSTDPAQRSVGTITLSNGNGSGIDLIGSGLIRSGTLASLVEMRDKTLVQAQTQLDTIAAKMSTALSNRDAPVTAAGSAPASGFSIDTTGLQNGNPVSITYTAAGSTKTAMFVQVADGTVLPLPASANGGDSSVEVIGYTASAGLQSAMDAKLSPLGFTVAQTGASVSVVNDGTAATAVNSLSGSVTNTALSGSGTALPLFVDGGTGSYYTGSFDNGVSQRTGLAARLSVNPAVIADPGSLVKYASGTLAGDPTRPQAILDALTKTQTSYQPDTGIGGSGSPFRGSVSSFVQSVVDTQGRDAQTAQNISEGQQVVVNALAEKMQSTSGVNIDSEMSNLLQLQNAYSANARVMSTIKDMLQTLLSM